MHIALITDGIYPCVIGGMQKHSFNLAKYMARLGHRVDLYHAVPKDNKSDYKKLFTEEELGNLRFFEVEFPSLGNSPGHYIRESYQYSEKLLQRYRKQQKPDFIYAKGFAGWNFLFKKTQGESFPPIGVNFHGYEMFQRAPSFVERLKQKFILSSPAKYNIDHADAVFSYGGKVTNIISSLGVPANKIIEIPGGIDAEWVTDKIKAKNGPLKFVFSGRDERRKGLKELFKALEALPAGDWEFHFIGPIKKKIFREQYTFHGSIDSKEKMSTLLKEMDVLVCPSISEGMPNVILEAMASGLAVIATDTGATSIMISEKNGWLLPPGDIPALTKAIQSALTANNLAEKKKNSVELVREKFLWDKIAALTSEKISVFLEEQKN
jgi:glycosyltransferase involved in cell wall biosynthesis